MTEDRRRRAEDLFQIAVDLPVGDVADDILVMMNAGEDFTPLDESALCGHAEAQGMV